MPRRPMVREQDKHLTRTTLLYCAAVWLFVASGGPFPASATALDSALENLQVTIPLEFVTLNDNFFDRIGVDFDFDINNDPPDSSVGFSELNNDPLAPLDIPLSESLSRLETAGALFPDPNLPGPGVEIGASKSALLSFPNGDVLNSPQTSLSTESRMGITAPPGVGARVYSQRVVALEVHVPAGLTGPLEFETLATFSADIVQPDEGVFGLGSLVELVSDISAFRFIGPDQSFDYSSASLGPYGSLYSSIEDFFLNGAILEFRGDGTVHHEIAQNELHHNRLYFHVAEGILLNNLSDVAAQISAFNTITYQLHSLTPGVTFQVAPPVPEPASLTLVGLFSAVMSLGTRQLRRQAIAV
jgi:hypothetical protein